MRKRPEIRPGNPWMNCRIFRFREKSEGMLSAFDVKVRNVQGCSASIIAQTAVQEAVNYLNDLPQTEPVIIYGPHDIELVGQVGDKGKYFPGYG